VAGDIDTIGRRCPDHAGNIAPSSSSNGHCFAQGFSPPLRARQFHDEHESATTGAQGDPNAKEWWCILPRPAISAKVIKELLRLGYLQPAKRFKPHVVERALIRLRADLVRDGVVTGGNGLTDPMPAVADDNQPSAQPSASVPGAST
jgi:hypothetical protein